MKKIPLFRIIKHTYYEKCDVEKEHYTIQVKKKFLFFWERWYTIKETVCGWGDCEKREIIFKTESEAIFAIKNLQNGYLSEGYKREVSTILDFNHENK